MFFHKVMAFLRFQCDDEDLADFRCVISLRGSSLHVYCHEIFMDAFVFRLV